MRTDIENHGGSAPGDPGPPPEYDELPPIEDDGYAPADGAGRAPARPAPPAAPLLLNPDQRAAVDHRGSPLLIIAGPGAGKTRTICERIRSIRTADAPAVILAVTFTRKAAGEMRERIGPGDRRTRVLTFHGFCVRFLRREHEAAGLRKYFPIWDEDDRLKAVKRAADELKLNLRKPQIKGAASRISFWKNLSVRPEDVVAHMGTRFRANPDNELHLRLYRRYEEIRIRAGACDFDDLLLETVAVLTADGGVRRYFQDLLTHILIDEYQDTNGPQKEIARLLAGSNPNLCVVGDPDQSIYSWRGARKGHIDGFADEFRAHVIQLHDNYRSGSSLVEASRGMMEEAADATRRGLRSARADAGEIRYLRPCDPHEEGDVVVKTAAYCEERGLTLGVLYRVNARSRPIENKLIKHRKAYKVVGGFAFHKRMEVRTALAILALTEDPHDDAAWERLAEKMTVGIGEGTLKKIRLAAAAEAESRTAPVAAPGLLGVDDDADTDGPAPGTLRWGAAEACASKGLTRKAANAVRALERTIRRLAAIGRTGSGPAERLGAGLAETGYEAWLTRNEDKPDDRIANLSALRDAAGEYERTADDPTIHGFIDDIVLELADPHKDAGAPVALMTMHSAKGLEFDVVIIAHAVQSEIPHPRSREPRSLAEERRLFYVAATRAKELLILSAPLTDISKRGVEPSEYVESMLEHGGIEESPTE